MSFEDIKTMLQKNIGLHSDSIGSSSIERAIVHRMDSLNLKQDSDYLLRLQNDKEELDELVEEVVVPETWFFRNLIPFETLAKCIPGLDGTASTNSEQIKILSIPCSTGEEPYSIAITLLKSGVPKGKFQIDAVDISKRALAKARRAIYGKHSFRESEGIADPDYFRETRAGQQLLPYVKEHVNFIKGNILKDPIAPGPGYYDIIFCRNLLIYFNRETQKQVLEKLNVILKNSGTLFVGHAETTDAGKNLFTRLSVPRSFAYKKNISTALTLAERQEEKPIQKLEQIYNQLVNVTLKDIELSRKREKKIYPEIKRKSYDRESQQPTTLEKVERLIEQGHLSAASSLCEKMLDTEPEEAQGYYYLGLISSIEGNVGSADVLLKKAIYLNPNHHKALGLSAMLAEQRGENTVAESLRFREIRAKKRTE